MSAGNQAREIRWREPVKSESKQNQQPPNRKYCKPTTANSVIRWGETGHSGSNSYRNFQTAGIVRRRPRIESFAGERHENLDQSRHRSSRTTLIVVKCLRGDRSSEEKNKAARENIESGGAWEARRFLELHRISYIAGGMKHDAEQDLN